METIYAKVNLIFSSSTGEITLRMFDINFPNSISIENLAELDVILENPLHTNEELGKFLDKIIKK